jgi:biotin synthase-related radical SAM superfamily protein
LNWADSGYCPQPHQSQAEQQEKFAKSRYNLLKLSQRLKQKNRITIGQITKPSANSSHFAGYFAKIGSKKKDRSLAISCFIKQSRRITGKKIKIFR